MKLLCALPEFFAANPKKLAVEENAGAGRTYFLKGDRIVAVATLPTNGENPCRS